MSNRHVEIIDGAMAVLESKGWRQRGGNRGRGRCVAVALAEAAEARWPDVVTLRELVVIDDLLELRIAATGFRPHLSGPTTLVQWNDAPGRTMGEVVALLTIVREELRAGFTSEPGEVVEYDGQPDPLVIPAEPAQEPATMPERETEPVPA